MQDYYAILNIKPYESKENIKRAFKRQALEWHPDRNTATEANERMQLINEAYLILGDDEARSKYDKEYNDYDNFKEDFSKEYSSFDDEILNEWVKKAKAQAKEMINLSIDDLLGMSKVAFDSAWKATKYYVLLLIILNFILIISTIAEN